MMDNILMMEGCGAMGLGMWLGGFLILTILALTVVWLIKQIRKPERD